DAQQDSSNIAKTRSKATLNEPNPQGESSGSGPGCQETIGGAMAKIRSEGVPIQYIDTPLLTCNTIELTDPVPQTPHDSHLSGGHTPGNIDDLVDEKVIFKDKGSGEKGSSTTEIVSTARPDISAARPEVSIAEPKNPPTTTTLFDDEDVTIADTLDRKRTTRKAFKAALARLYDEVQAQIYADHELAARLTHKEQEKYIVEERSKLLAKFFKIRKKQLAKERAQIIRSKPPTKTQLRNIMMTYVKHTCRFTHAQLKSRSFEEIQKLYTKEQKWIDAFVHIGSEENEKRVGNRKKRAAGSSLKQKLSKKQKVNDQESVDSDKELMICL
nr:hypothetical protein [Tanacetum cinerariifolium]